MKINACDTSNQTVVKEKPGTKTSEDSFQVLLQLLLGGILNAGGNIPQDGKALMENGLQNGKTAETSLDGISKISGLLISSLANNTADVLPTLNQPQGAYTEVGASDAQDSLASSLKNQAAPNGTREIKTSGQAVLNNQVPEHFDNLTAKLLEAVKAAPVMEGAKTDAQNIGGKEVKDAAVQGRSDPVQKTIPEQQTAEMKQNSMAFKDNLSILGVKELTKGMEIDRLTSSNGKDKEGLESKSDTGQKAAKNYASDKGDAKAALKDSIGILQNAVDYKSISQKAETRTVQKGAEQSIPVNKDDILNQVYDKIKVLNNDSSPELHISLKPDELGDVSIKLVMEKGAINARITVENSSIKNIMDTSTPQIKEHLKEQNVNVSNISVYVGTGEKENDSGGNFQQYRWQQHKGRHYKNAAPAVKAGESQYLGGVLNLLA